MIDTDKVLIGLGQHISGRTSKRCWKCPYFNGDSGYGVSCRDELLDDIYELLETREEAQEPRVMTLDMLIPDGVVYLEDCDKDNTVPGIYCNGHSGYRIFATKNNGYLFVEDADYMSRWRCWTSQPSKAEMEAAPWN